MTLGVREYIGARYVPVFADPIQWDITTLYEPLTVVMNEGASYVSRKSVPAGIELSNTDYWILWADYNAQLQHYIDIVNTFDTRIETLEYDLPITEFDNNNTVDDRFDAIEANSWVTTSRIADANVTTDKIADAAITTAKIDDAAITSAKILDDAVTTSKIPDSAITNVKLASNSVTRSKIADHSIPKVKLDTTKTYAFIGDSFSDDQYYSWVPNLARLLGAHITNKAKSAAGFTTSSSNNFLLQLQELASDSYDYTDIIIYGGANDDDASASTLTTAMNTFFTYFKNNFSDVQLHCFYANIPQKAPQDVAAQVKTMTDATINNVSDAKIYPDVNGWQLACFGCLSTTNRHPSPYFLAKLPYLFYNAIVNGNTHVCEVYEFTPNSSLTDITWDQLPVAIATEKGLTMTRGSITGGLSGTANLGSFNFQSHGYIQNPAHQYYRSYPYVLEYNSSATSASVSGFALDTGRITVYNPHISNGTGVSITPATLFWAG